MMNTTDLQVGQKYRIKDSVEFKVCDRPMTYTGTETYRGVTYHAFWDNAVRLSHWIDPKDVEPA